MGIYFKGMKRAMKAQKQRRRWAPVALSLDFELDLREEHLEALGQEVREARCASVAVASLPLLPKNLERNTKSPA